MQTLLSAIREDNGHPNKDMEEVLSSILLKQASSRSWTNQEKKMCIEGLKRYKDMAIEEMYDEI